jgi:hypothetical protein
MCAGLADVKETREAANAPIYLHPDDLVWYRVCCLSLTPTGVSCLLL